MVVEATAWEASISYGSAGSSPGRFASDPSFSAHVPGEAANDGLNAWAPATRVRHSDEVAGSWLWPWLLSG